MNGSHRTHRPICERNSKFNCATVNLRDCVFIITILLLVKINTAFSSANTSPIVTPPLETVYSLPGSYTFTVPADVYSITVATWGGGGRGGSRTSGTSAYGGGGGGAYSLQTISVTPGQTYVVNVGSGSTTTSAGGDSWMSVSNVSSAFVLAKGGNSVPNNSTLGATGGSASASIGSVKYGGGRGADQVSISISGGGGSSAGSASNGSNAFGENGGIAPLGGGNGGNGRNTNGNGFNGLVPGGGGGGAVRTSGSPIGGAGANGRVVISYEVQANAGPNISQCDNAIFKISGNVPPVGYSGYWTILSGNVFYQGSLSGNEQTVVLNAGTTATMRYTLSDGISSTFDDIILTHTTGCSPICDYNLSRNGDLENLAIPLFDLNFNSVDAFLIDENNSPEGWYSDYGTNTPSESSFEGAFLMKKTSSQGNPYSGNQMVLLSGVDNGIIPFDQSSHLACGKELSFNIKVAAFSKAGAQSAAPFSISFIGYTDDATPIIINQTTNLMAPPSTSWNALNWQNYKLNFTVPFNNLVNLKVKITSLSNNHSIVIDDFCLSSIFEGATALAGDDLSSCETQFFMNANTPEVGYSGTWSVVQGNATIGNSASPTTQINIAEGSVNTLRWTVTGGGVSQNTIINPSGDGGFENSSTMGGNGWTAINHGTNKWYVGSVAGATNGANSAYISNNGGTSYTYSNNLSQTSHFYRDVTVPAGETQIDLAFKWKNIGETEYDRILVYVAPTSVIPGAGIPASNSSVLPGATLVSSGSLHGSSTFQNANIALPPSLAGTTFRLIFTWQNDGSVGSNPPAAIDEISLISFGPACTNYDEVVISSREPVGIDIKNTTICRDSIATLSVTGCTNAILWNTGETTESITVSPSATTTFSATCTPVNSDIILNGDFEDATDLDQWSNVQNATITTDNNDIHSGAKACVITSTTGLSGVEQAMLCQPGELLEVSAWVKLSVANPSAKIGIRFVNSLGNQIGEIKYASITGHDYEEISISAVSPANSHQIIFFAHITDIGSLFIDDVTLTSLGGCIETADATVTVLPKPLINHTSSNVTVEDGSDGWIDLFITQGTAPYTFQWSNGMTTQDLPGLSAGIYSVTVHDANNCGTASESEIPIGHPGDCEGFRTQTQGGWGTNASGGNPGAYRDANFAAAFPNGLTIGCTNTLKFTTSAAVNTFLPSGSTGSLLPTGNMVNPNNYKNVFAGQLVAATLSVGFDLHNPNFGPATENLKDLIINTGPFLGKTVEFLITEANKEIGGCNTPYSITDFVNALTDVNENYVDGLVTGSFLVCCRMDVQTNGDELCIGNAGEVSAYGNGGYAPYTYSWSNALGNGQFKSVAPITTTNYTVTVTDIFGCSLSAVASVIINPLPQATIYGDNDICIGELIQLTASGGAAFEWNNGSTTSSINVSPGTQTSYTVTVTDANGCSDTEVKTLNVNALPIITSVSPDTRCGPGSVTLEATSNAGVIRWYDQAIGGNLLGTGTSFSIAISNTQTFYVEAYHLDCISESRLAVTATILPLPIAKATSNSPLHPGSTILLFGKGGDSYLWSGPNGFTSNLQNPQIDNADISASGWYYLLVTAPNGCQDIDSVEVLINQTEFDWNHPCGVISTEVIGNGIQCQSNTIVTIQSPLSVDRIIVEVLYKGDNPGSSITISDAANNTYLAQRVSIVQAGADVWLYRVQLPATSTVFYTDLVTSCYAQSMQVLVIRNDGSQSQSTGKTVYDSGENDIKSMSLSIPPSTIQRQIKAIVPLSGLSHDGRYVKVTATAGSVSASSIYYGPDLNIGNCCLLNAEIFLPLVPPGVTEITIEIDSRNNENNQYVNGQSWILAGIVTLEGQCCPVLPSPPSANNTTICGNGSATLSVSGSQSGTYEWFTSPNSRQWFHTGSNYTISNLTHTETYFVSNNIGGCVSERIAVTANNLNPLLDASSLLNLCPDEPVGIINAYGGSGYLWSNGATTSSIEVSPNSSTTYFVTITSPECPSVTLPVEVVVGEDCCTGNSQENLIGSYDFVQSGNTIIHDLADNGPKLNLAITDIGSTQWVADCGLGLTSPTVLSSLNQANKIKNAIVSSNEMSVDFWLYPGNNASASTILSLSNGSNQRNFALVQEGNSFIIYRNINGSMTGEPAWTVPNAALQQLQHITYTRDKNGLEKFYVDGNLIQSQIVAGNYNQWVNSYMHIGNEIGEDKSWIGILYHLNIYNKALSPGEIAQNQNASSSGECYNCLEPQCPSRPQSPVGTAGERCGEGIVVLSATGCPDGTISWYSRPTGGQFLGKGVNFNTPYLTKSKAFYADCTLDGCVSERVMIMANVKDLPDLTTSLNDTICAGETVNLQAISNYPVLWSNGNTDSSISLSPLVSTQYSVTATGINGCTSTNTIFIEVNPIPVCQITGSSEICAGDTITLQSSIANSYIWSNGSTESSITVADEMTYHLTVTNQFGCTATDSHFVEVHSLPVVDILGDNRICLGDSSMLNVSNGISYIWSNGSTSNAIEVKLPDFYTVTVTDVNNCIGSDTITFVVDTLPIPVIEGGDRICLLANTQLNASGGSNYLWNTGESTSSITTIAPGVYIITVSDSHGCSASTSTLVQASPNFTVNVDYNGSICVHDSSYLTAYAVNGQGPFLYEWQGPGGLSSTNYDIITSQNGIYNVTITDANRCTATSTGFIHEEFNPTFLSTSSQLCEGDTTTISVDGGIGSTYLWNNAANNATTSTVIVTPQLPSSLYTVTVTSDIGCTAEHSTLINVIPRPVNNLTGNDSICEGQFSTITSSLGGLWLSEDNDIAVVDPSGIIYGLAAGLTRFTRLDTVTGCKSVASDLFTVVDKPSAGPDPSVVACFVTDSVTLNGSGLGFWVPDVNNSGTATIKSPNASVTIVNEFSTYGNYTFYYRNSFGCEDTVSFNITNTCICPINNNHITNGSSNTFCNEGTNILLNGTEALPVGGVYQWEIQVGNGEFTNAPSISTSKDYLIGTLSVGQYKFRRKYNTINRIICHHFSDTISITVHPLPQLFSIDDNEICLGQETYVSAQEAGSWYTLNDSIATINSAGLISSHKAGTAVFEFVSNLTGCENHSELLTVHPKPVTISESESEKCQGLEWSFEPASQGVWVSSDPQVAQMNGPGRAVALMPGNVHFTYTHSLTGCKDTTDIYFVLPKPIITHSGQTNLCVGQSKQLFSSESGTWSVVNTNIAGISTSGLLTGLTGGQAKVLFTSNTSLCLSDTLIITIRELPAVTIDIDGDPCLKLNKTINVQTSGGSAPYSFQWLTPIGQQPITPAITISNVGNYHVNVTDQFGCSQSRSVFIYQTYTPVLIQPQLTICDGDTITLNASGDGSPTFQWSSNAGSSNAPSVDVMPGLPSSTYSVTVTNNLGCSSTLSATVFVSPKPVISVFGSDSICIGSNTQMLPASGGSWSSLNPGIATISNNGLILGRSEGDAQFKYISFTSGCSSNTSAIIYVHRQQQVSITGDSLLCPGETIQLSPSNGGLWFSNNPSIATVTKAGLVTALSAGQISFSYLDTITGCQGNQSINLTINEKPIITIPGARTLCEGAIKQLFATGIGVWTSSNRSAATIDNDGIISGITQGTTKFTFTNSSTGCSSDTTDWLDVLSRPIITSVSNTVICAGTTTQLAASGPGFWRPLNGSIASINSLGLATGVSSGKATFSYISATNGCESAPSDTITVLPLPIISISGPTSICEGQNTTLTSANTGSWSSIYPSLASINNLGIVTGLSSGFARFTFTDVQGCTSLPSGIVQVKAAPTIQLSGPDVICQGATTNMLPSVGGSWESLNLAIASINNQGLVSGLSGGSTTFKYTDAVSGCSSTSIIAVQVIPRPIITNIGTSHICIGQSTLLQSSSPGIWQANHPLVATISSSGLVQGVGPGFATFTLTTTQGCVSNPTSQIIVNHRPSIQVIGKTTLCIGNTIQMSPITGGTWISSNSIVATITNNGTVTAIGPGTVRFVYTETNTGCQSDSSVFFQVLQRPTVSLLGASNICVGNTTQFSPSSGGNWISNNPIVASISSSGIVTGHNAGNVTFVFSNTATGCQSSPTTPITVNATPTIGFKHKNSICLGDTVSVFPSSGGIWTSGNPSVATISSDGIINGLNPGGTQFVFTSLVSGCSATTAFLTVYQPPSVSILGNPNICIGANVQLLPSVGGIWTSDDPTLASVTASGVVTGINSGLASFSFLDNATGCSADGGLNITVNQKTSISLVGTSDICVGFNAQLLPSSGGSWTSSDPSIASINDQGIIKGLAAGQVSFSYFDYNSTCTTNYDGDDIYVNHCIHPDINGGFINSVIVGNAKTNDLSNFTYSNAAKTKSPSGSLAIMNFNSDGTYTFSSDQPGRYEYTIKVCDALNGLTCANSLLAFDIHNPNSAYKASANIDFVHVFTTDSTRSILVNVLENDDCIGTDTCEWDKLTLSIVKQGKYGQASAFSNGLIGYQYFGLNLKYDTITYQICLKNNPLICSQADVIIMTGKSNAKNALTAVDDFIIGMKGFTQSLSLISNDYDVEGNLFSVNPIGSPSLPVMHPDGSYYISSDGIINYLPNPSFEGLTQISYTICDNNIMNQKCVNGTAYFLILPDMSVKIRAYLQGALVGNRNEISSDGKPLMRDDLRESPFNGLNYIPSKDPYSFDVSNISLAQNKLFRRVGPGQLYSNQIINDSIAIFSVKGENAIVDWVFVELRDPSDYTKVLATRSGLLQRDGDIVDIDGSSLLKFQGYNLDSCFVVLKHRNHLGVMSKKISTSRGVDFTENSTPIHTISISNSGVNFDNIVLCNHTALGVKSLWAGDMNGDGRIKFTSPNDDQNILFYDVIAHAENLNGTANFNFGFGYLQGDFDMNSKTKFDNPDDDKNMLFFQIITNSQNSKLLSNFDFLISQVPVANFD